MNNYDDIINHPAWEPRYRKRMSPPQEPRNLRRLPRCRAIKKPSTTPRAARKRKSTTPAHTIFRRRVSRIPDKKMLKES